MEFQTPLIEWMTLCESDIGWWWLHASITQVLSFPFIKNFQETSCLNPKKVFPVVGGWGNVLFSTWRCPHPSPWWLTFEKFIYLTALDLSCGMQDLSLQCTDLWHTCFEAYEILIPPTPTTQPGIQLSIHTWLLEKPQLWLDGSLSANYHKVSWVLKNWCFWTVVLEKILESPLDCKEIKPVNPKGNQSWIFIGRTNAEAPILLPPDASKNWLLGKDPDAGKDWRQEEKGTTENEMVGWHHRLNGNEFE